ncbi:MAG TPA: hypothetical protein VM260_26030, partial [Pirellula sp.]|nr:hypothetical protein [Pirellula sp.]
MPSVRRITSILITFLAFSSGVPAEDEAHSGARLAQPGHSIHGEAFNEGPRQAAYLMNGMGNVRWEISTKNPMAQRFFDQGIVQLHGFWYFEAERSFRQAAAFDPECPILYWGMARANIENPLRSKGFIEQAMKRIDKATNKEKRLVEAWNKRMKDTKEEPANSGESKSPNETEKKADTQEKKLADEKIRKDRPDRLKQYVKD